MRKTIFALSFCGFLLGVILLLPLLESNSLGQRDSAADPNSTFDNVSGSNHFITFPHHKLHNGDSYQLQVTSDNLGGETGDHLTLSFVTPDSTKLVHVFPNAYGSGEIYFTMREAPTGGGTAGSAATVLQRNRSLSNVSDVTSPLKAVAVGTGGTLLEEQYIGAGKDKAAGETRDRGEWVLARNTRYIFRAYTTADVQSVLTVDWYESVVAFPE